MSIDIDEYILIVHEVLFNHPDKRKILRELRRLMTELLDREDISTEDIYKRLGSFKWEKE